MVTSFLHIGLIRQPKYGHLKELHRAKLCGPTLVSADPIVTQLGDHQQVSPRPTETRKHAYAYQKISLCFFNCIY